MSKPPQGLLAVEIILSHEMIRKNISFDGGAILREDLVAIINELQELVHAIDTMSVAALLLEKEG